MTLQIDAHAHQIPGAFLAAVERAGGRYPLPGIDAVTHLAAMDAHATDLAVISLPPPGAHVAGCDDRLLARAANDAFADLAGAHPRRLAALAALPLSDPAAATAEAVRALDELGLAGVVLPSNAAGAYPGDARFAELLAELDRRDAYVLLHPADPGWVAQPAWPPWLVELPFETTRAVTSLLVAGALAARPRIRWQVAHCGGAIPFLAHRIATLADREPALAARMGPDPAARLAALFYDTAQADNAPALAATRALAGSARIVFGTDWPYAVLPGRGRPQPGVDGIAGVRAANALRMAPRLRRSIDQHDTKEHP